MSEQAVPSTAELQILLVLAGERRHGYAIMQEVERRSAGRTRLGPGTLYGAIKRMLASGWIESSEAGPAGAGDDARRTRYYALTRAGRKAATAAAEQMADLVRTAAERGLIRVRISTSS